MDVLQRALGRPTPQDSVGQLYQGRGVSQLSQCLVPQIAEAQVHPEACSAWCPLGEFGDDAAHSGGHHGLSGGGHLRHEHQLGGHLDLEQDVSISTGMDLLNFPDCGIGEGSSVAK